MNQRMIFYCSDESQTKKLAQNLASVTKPGDVWALYGTLGAGKSVFSRAFIQALTGASEVPSPTFTLVQTYDADNFEIYHYDLYRLKSAEEIWELNIEEAVHEAVCLIEWPEKMGPYLPKNSFKLEINVISPQKREIILNVNCDEKWLRLQALCKPES